MKTYKITFGTKIYVTEIRLVAVEDFECEQDALDRLIDHMEFCGETGCFLNDSQLAENGGEHFEDEYVTGGNHGLHLYHGGCFEIKLF